jgi:hypothetical protein
MFQAFSAQWRMMAKDDEGREPRLPDVKPPCSNLAGAFGSGHFLFCLSKPLRVPARPGRTEAIPGPAASRVQIRSR